MGQSSSSEHASPAQSEAESLAASTGALPILREAFSRLSDPETSLVPVDSIVKCLGLVIENPSSGTAESCVPKEFQLLMVHVGSAIVDLFVSVDKGGVTWVEFLRGYIKCCARSVASSSLNNLFKVFVMANEKTGIPAKLQFESIEESEDDGKLVGSLLPNDLLTLLWLCWILSRDSRTSRSSRSPGLPDLDHLVFSAVEFCSESGDKLNLWDAKISELDVQLPASNIHLWALKTVPYLADCLAHFVHSRIGYMSRHEGKLEDLSFPVHCISPEKVTSSGLLTSGRAWAISLTLRSTVKDEISKVCFPSENEGIEELLLYRSSLHGRGLSRFWSQIEGYNGPVLLLIDAGEKDNAERRSLVAVLTDQGFENKQTFYGSSGILYSISPVFHYYVSSGKERNFMYCHLHPKVGRYEPHPKPEGIAFGGSIGNPRIFMGEDFSKLTLGHHAFDKTYQHGPLIPNQGFLPTEMAVMGVEAWGLGGAKAIEVQTSYKKREQLFNDQRRKVDLNSFGSWEDTPERMMMDMVTDPNRPRREER